MIEFIAAVALIVGAGFLFGGRKGAQIALGLAVLGFVAFTIYAVGVGEQQQKEFNAQKQLCQSRGGSNLSGGMGWTAEPDKDGCYLPSAPVAYSPYAFPLSYKFVSDGDWKYGEVKQCTLDGAYREAHCFPPKSIRTLHSDIYLVSATFDAEPVFDKHQWSVMPVD